MKSILELDLGFNDAENYRRRENRQLLNSVFIRNEYLEKLCEPAISFLIGEKGTGKTAYAVYLSNNNYKDNRACIRYIRETEYQKFIRMKQEKHLDLSDYTSIWKTILYLLMSQQVCDAEGGPEFLERFSKLRHIRKAVDEYYSYAFSPEIATALQFVQNSKLAAELLAKHAKIISENNDSITFSETRFQVNLLFIQRSFETALRQPKYNSNHILFIDGIDIRPSSIPYPEYLECIKGLANAIWEINNDFFPSIRDSGGRLRVVLLIRPDIYESLGLQNQNTKIRSNSVFLNWHTDYLNHRSSGLFQVIDRLLQYQQQENLALGDAWDHYFPWNTPSVYENFDKPSSFLSFVRWSYYRPRDIVTMLDCLQQRARINDVDAACFDQARFDDPAFRRDYSRYLLGEVKDHLSFYYSSNEYEIFLKFFIALNGKAKFTFNEYLDVYQAFKASSGLSISGLPVFMATPELFLQFLYDLNIICYEEYPVNDRPYTRWCFLERNYSNISPKVKENVTYVIFYGLRKALNVGSEFMRNSI
jgi:hypothetical protein